ncbi:AraC-like DNA-binding protein [Rhodococcus sp. 27YEA15]|uniref:DUF5995 family protein n=1 Tax=Rhodococcus sp. 27YEA15 TaxID=3156259 RepID=UPI003C7AD388
MRIIRSATRSIAVMVTTAALLTGGVAGSGADPSAAPRVDDSLGTQLIVGAAGLAPVQALLQISRELFPDGAPYLPWTYQLPPAPVPHTPAHGVCPDGADQCITDTIIEMERRIEIMKRDCDDNAPLLLSYLHTTKEEHSLAAAGDGFGADKAHVNDWSTSYAHLYFTAYDNYYVNGRPDLVPESWKQNFRASDDHSLTVFGNVAAAYNAHITHDLPMVIAQMGVTAPDGHSYKPAHETINALLAEAEKGTVEELARTYGTSDPALQAAFDSEPGTGFTFGQLIQVWREYAWRAAEQLLLAPDDNSRRSVEQQIDRTSNFLGDVVLRLFARTDTGPRVGRCPSQ